jgi:pyruvate/2-oxoglutarate dehydrogenase complex dihydrolipoamide dehydrogenase (E3) component
MPDFDMAVVGAGAAGLSVTAVAAQLGLRVVLIERGRMGGECLNTGCVPSKALLAAAHAAQDAAEAERFGVRLPPAAIDWQAVQAHVHGVIAALAPADSVARFEGLGATVLHGEARFRGPSALAVDGRTLSAGCVVVAAGSRPAIPPIPGLRDLDYLTHATLFDLPQPPEHLLILGGGAIGLEMAQAHAGLGCQVTIVEQARLAAREDAELVDVLRQRLLAQGVAIVEDVRVVAAKPGPSLLLADGRRLRGSHLLVAAGRAPNLEGLGCEAAGVPTTPRGIATDAGLRSIGNRRVFAVGDIADPRGIGPVYQTHAASHHAGVVIRRAVFRLPARVESRAMPRVTYTDPELAQVGPTEAAAREAGLRVDALRWQFADNDRAQTERRSEGMVKLVVRGGRVLGAGIVGRHAGETIGAWTLAIARRIPLSAMAELIVPYPTRAEGAKRAAGTAFSPRLFAPATRRVVALLARLPRGIGA